MFFVKITRNAKKLTFVTTWEKPGKNLRLSSGHLEQCLLLVNVYMYRRSNVFSFFIFRIILQNVHFCSYMTKKDDLLI